MLTALAFFLAPAAAAAANADCDKLEKQADRNDCYVKALRKSEAAMADTYKSVAGRIPANQPGSLVTLELSQEAWIIYRDTGCLFAASGSATAPFYTAVLAQCKDDAARAREATLSGYLHCKADDPACPVPPQ